MSAPRASAPTGAPPPKSRKHKEWLIVFGVLAAFAIALLVASRDFLFGTSRTSISPPHPTTPAAPTNPLQAEAQKNGAEQQSQLVDDDGKTLWESPTDGKPLHLAYLPPGVQIIIAARPADLLKHSEGAIIRAALGPLGQEAISYLERITTLPLNDIEQLLLGCQITGQGKWLITIVAHTANPISRDSLIAKLPKTTEKDHGGKKYWLAGEHAYYLPIGAENRTLIVAPEDAIHEVIDLNGQPPPLGRDLERLIAHTDADRHLTVILAPNSLFAEGQTMFSGEALMLRDPLFWFLGDELSGTALSMNWNRNFFLELLATPNLDISPERTSRDLAERIHKIPEQVEQYVVTLNPQPYGRLVIARLPEMVRKLAEYTRRGFEGDHAVLRCYLPVVAGHNLFLGTELTLAESLGGASQAAQSAAPVKDTAISDTDAKNRLAKVTSLKFARDTLESALDQLSQDIGVPIVIRGPDLQADGITKNQSFGIDVSGKPAGEILVEILRLANPDKTSPGPSDSRQKLVYIIEQKPDKTEQIVVTTRARAAERHDELPAAFRLENPSK